MTQEFVIEYQIKKKLIKNKKNYQEYKNLCILLTLLAKWNSLIIVITRENVKIMWKKWRTNFMKEVLFENQYIRTKDYYKEYYGGIYLKKPIIIILNIILSISFITNLLLIVFPKLSTQDSRTSLATIASILIILCIEIYVYINNVNLTYTKELEKNRGNCSEIKLSITDDNINILTNLKSNMNIQLKNINNVIKTKNYYILITKAKLRIAIKKDGFIKGTAEKFEKFLTEKNFG